MTTMTRSPLGAVEPRPAQLRPATAAGLAGVLPDDIGDHSTRVWFDDVRTPVATPVEGASQLPSDRTAAHRVRFGTAVDAERTPGIRLPAD